MDSGNLQGIGTVLAFLAFIGVCCWAFSKHKKRDFEEAAQLPFADEQSTTDHDAKIRVRQEKTERQT